MVRAINVRGERGAGMGGWAGRGDEGVCGG